MTTTTRKHIQRDMLTMALRVAYIDGALSMSIIALGIYAVIYGFSPWMVFITLWLILMIAIAHRAQSKAVKWVEEGLSDE